MVKKNTLHAEHGSLQSMQRIVILFFSKLFNDVQHKPVHQACQVLVSPGSVGRRVPSHRVSESNCANTPKVLPKIKETSVRLSCKKHVMCAKNFSHPYRTHTHFCILTVTNTHTLLASFSKHEKPGQGSLQPHKHSFCLSSGIYSWISKSLYLLHS